MLLIGLNRAGLVFILGGDSSTKKSNSASKRARAQS